MFTIAQDIPGLMDLAKHWPWYGLALGVVGLLIVIYKQLYVPLSDRRREDRREHRQAMESDQKSRVQQAVAMAEHSRNLVIATQITRETAVIQASQNNTINASLQHLAEVSKMRGA